MHSKSLHKPTNNIDGKAATECFINLSQAAVSGFQLVCASCHSYGGDSFKKCSADLGNSRRSMHMGADVI